MVESLGGDKSLPIVGTKGVFAKEISLADAIDQADKLITEHGLGSGKESFGYAQQKLNEIVSREIFGLKKKTVDTTTSIEFALAAKDAKKNNSFDSLVRRYKTTESKINKVIDFIESSNFPTKYFEAKSMGDVDFNDVVLVVPNKAYYDMVLKAKLKGTKLENRVLVGTESNWLVEKGMINDAQKILGEEKPSQIKTKSQLIDI